jgi:GGDEF domain-containing protein
MISIKKFMGGSSDSKESIAAYERMAQLLLQAIGLHAVEGDRSDYDGFRAAVADLQTSLAEDPSPANILVSTGSAVKALQDYNRRTSNFIRARGIELQSIVGMLTQAMSQISTGSEVSIHRLHDLEKQIEHASMVEDMRTLKTRLSECLETIQTETVRQRDDSKRVVADLDQGLRKAQEPQIVRPVGEADSLTGIPMRPQAEQAMRTACADGVHTYAALFLLDRIQAISSRFGFALGDQVILFFLQHLSQGLRADDQIFRWGPGAFLALLPRKEAAAQVRSELGKFLSRRMEQSFAVADRSVVVPIGSTWVVVPLFESGVNEVVHKLEVFASAATG